MDKKEIDWGGNVHPIMYELMAGDPDMNGETYDSDSDIMHPGITIRTYAAIRAMQALIPMHDDKDWNPQVVACIAVQYADALLARLGEDDASE